jgi:hypothetical protein
MWLGISHVRNPDFKVYKNLVQMIKYGNKRQDKQADHRYLEIPGMSSVGSSSPQNLKSKFSDL